MELSCTFKPVQWENNRKLYTCVVKTASVTVRGAEIKTISGKHLDKTNGNVQGIWFSNNDLKFFPQGLHKIFPNLIAVNIKNCGLTTISHDDLKGLENLKAICLDSNLLTSVPSNLFSTMRKLKAISIRDNQLETLSSNLLKPLMGNGLTIVDLRDNTSISAWYAPGLTGSLASIQHLAQEIDTKCGREIEDKEAFLALTATQPTKMNESFADKIQKRFLYLLSSGHFSDFTIIAGGKKFRVHKCVISIQSTKFASLFEQDKQINEMIIEDFTKGAVEAFIKFIYSGELQDELHAIELFGLSSDLQVPELRAKCERIILTNIRETNADSVFAIAHRYGSEDMRKLALVEIKKMFSGIVFPNELLNNPEKMKDLIETKRKSDRAKKEFDEKLGQYGMSLKV